MINIFGSKRTSKANRKMDRIIKRQIKASEYMKNNGLRAVTRRKRQMEKKGGFV